KGKLRIRGEVVKGRAMYYQDQWTKEQVDAFYAWVSEQPAFRPHIFGEFPKLAVQLKGKGLRPEDADALAKYLKWVRVLPYANQKIGCDLLVFYYTDFQRISRLLQKD